MSFRLESHKNSKVYVCGFFICHRRTNQAPKPLNRNSISITHGGVRRKNDNSSHPLEYNHRLYGSIYNAYTITYTICAGNRVCGSLLANYIYVHMIDMNEALTLPKDSFYYNATLITFVNGMETMYATYSFLNLE